jgi:hypothetical protein
MLSLNRVIPAKAGIPDRRLSEFCTAGGYGSALEFTPDADRGRGRPEQ